MHHTTFGRMANKEPLRAAASVLFRVCLWRSAVAGGVVARMLDHSRLVPTATLCRLTNTHTPHCGTERHAHLESVCRLPHPVCSQVVRSLLCQCIVAWLIAIDVRPLLDICFFDRREASTFISSADSRTSPSHLQALHWKLAHCWPLLS